MAATIFAAFADTLGAIEPRIAPGRTYDSFAGTTDRTSLFWIPKLRALWESQTLATRLAILVGDTPHV